jgi:uncharacterized protein (DUF924 family)
MRTNSEERLMSKSEERAGEITEFWFEGALSSSDAAIQRNNVWFGADDTFDAEIATRFKSLPDEALSGKLDGWLLAPATGLSLILVLDQFPRNLFRGDPRSYAFDELARAAARQLIRRGFDEVVEPLEAVFLYLPFEHSEDLEDQLTSMELFRSLEDRAVGEENSLFEGYSAYARQHHDTIARFGRFPMRNQALGRVSTEEELVYIEEQY